MADPHADGASDAAASPPSRDELLAALPDAAPRGEIEVVYQPQIDLRTERVVAVEALARWRHPVWGIVPPDDFVPLAERAGLITGITATLLDTATRDGRGWHEAGHPLEVAFNVSAEQLRAEDFVEGILAALSANRFPPSALIVEITQSQSITDYRAASAPLVRLSGLGANISIDDFGTGYSNLGRLSALPATEVKIDRSILESASARSTIDMVVGLAHRNGVRVVAEGVETLQQLQLVRSLGCDRVQGFYFASPLSAAEITGMLAVP